LYEKSLLAKLLEKGASRYPTTPRLHGVEFTSEPTKRTGIACEKKIRHLAKMRHINKT
jgi:hypothetical protein